MGLVRDIFWVFRQSQHWMPLTKWTALVQGEGCEICADVDAEESKFGFCVARLQVANLILPKNQYARGYCLLTYREHATELHELVPEKRDAFFHDLTRAATAVAHVFKPIKMNYQILGNLTPHLHCHITPRYWGDPAPGRPLNTFAGRRLLSREEYRRIIEELQSELTRSG